MKSGQELKQESGGKNSEAGIQMQEPRGRIPEVET